MDPEVLEITLGIGGEDEVLTVENRKSVAHILQSSYRL
jgi:hypothetical protein